MCDKRARMLLHQFSVNVNHVCALAILISTFHYSKTVSAIDQVKVFEFLSLVHFNQLVLRVREIIHFFV